MKPDLFLTPSEVRQLRHMTRRAIGRVALRALMVLWRAEGIAMVEIADRLGVHRDTVTTWIDRYRSLGIPGLEDDGDGRTHEYPEREGNEDGHTPEETVFRAEARHLANLRKAGRAHLEGGVLWIRTCWSLFCASLSTPVCRPSAMAVG